MSRCFLSRFSRQLKEGTYSISSSGAVKWHHIAAFSGSRNNSAHPLRTGLGRHSACAPFLRITGAQLVSILKSLKPNVIYISKGRKCKAHFFRLVVEGSRSFSKLLSGLLFSMSNIHGMTKFPHPSSFWDRASDITERK